MPVSQDGTFQVKRTTTAGKVPTSSDLLQAELGVNVTDSRLFIRADNGSTLVLEIALLPRASTKTAAGTTQGTATLITTGLTTITGGTDGQGVILGTPVIGGKLIIENKTLFSIKLYPASGHSFDTSPVNEAITLLTGAYIELIGLSSTSWLTSNRTQVLSANVVGTFPASSTLLSNYATAPSNQLIANDTALTAFGKLQAQINTNASQIQDLSAITKQLHASPNSVNSTFIYDTRRDTDHGEWINKIDNLSYQTETLATNTFLGRFDSELSARGDNLVSHGEQFDNNLWAKTLLTPTADNILAPDGTMTGDRLTEATGTNNHCFLRTMSSLAVSTAYKWTLAIKAGSISTVRFTISSSGNQVAVNNIDIDLSTGVFSATDLSRTNVTPLGNGWWEVACTTTTTASATSLALALFLTPTPGVLSYAGNAANYVYVWGGRFQTAATASSVYDTFSSQAGKVFQLTTDGKFYSLGAGSGALTEVFRGNRAKPPRVMGLVLEDGTLTIYDLTDQTCPMWMRIVNSSLSLSTTTGVWADANLVGRQVRAMNGLICIACNGSTSGALIEISLIEDSIRISKNSASATFVGLFDRLADRHTVRQRTDAYNGGRVLISDRVNSVAMTVIDGSISDSILSLPQPTIAVGTAAGVSIIKDDDSVVNDTSTQGSSAVCTTVSWSSKKYLIRNWTDGLRVGEAIVQFPTADADYNVFRRMIQNVADTLPKLSNDMLSPGLTYFSKAGRAVGASDTNYSINLVKSNWSDKAKSVVCTITPYSTSGYMPGDIRRVFFCDIVSGNATAGANFVTNSAFTGSIADWFAFNGATLSNVSNQLRATVNGIDQGAYTVIPTTIGVGYVISGNTQKNSSDTFVGIFTQPTNSTSAMVSTGTTTALLQSFVATATSTNVIWRTSGGSGTYTGSFDIDVVSARVCVMDRSPNSAGMKYTGTLSRTAVATGADLMGFSAWSTTNYCREDRWSSELDLGTGDVYLSGWIYLPSTYGTAAFVAGSNLVANGAFGTDLSGWSASAEASISLVSSAMRVTRGTTGTYPRAIYTLTGLTVGTVYEINSTFLTNASGLTLFIGRDNVTADIVTATGVTGTLMTRFIATATSHAINVGINLNSGNVNDFADFDNITLAALSPGFVLDRNFASGPYYNVTVDAKQRVAVTLYDGTTTRTLTASVQCNLMQWSKIDFTYSNGVFNLNVDDINVATYTGAALNTLTNTSATFYCGINYLTTMPFRGSFAMIKVGATAPTPEQLTWMFQREKQLFKPNAKAVLPSYGNVVDLTYDETNDKWSVVQATGQSHWTGVNRTSIDTPSSGSYTGVAAANGIKLLTRSTTNPGVDIQVEKIFLKEELKKTIKSHARSTSPVVIFDRDVITFTGTVSSGSNQMTAVTSIVGTPYLGMWITGSGFVSGTSIIAISGTTYTLSTNSTGAFTASYGQADFTLPVGYSTTQVVVDGALKREGPTKAYVRRYDGFKETIRFSTTPGVGSWVQIGAVKSD